MSEIQRGQELRNRIKKINHMEQREKNNLKYLGVDKIQYIDVVYHKTMDSAGQKAADSSFTPNALQIHLQCDESIRIVPL